VTGIATGIRPFRIDIPEAELDDLRRRLDQTRWPDDPAGEDWSYGIPVSYLRDLAGYWRTGYDWRAQEAGLNRFPQFITELDGQRVHFAHVRSPEPGALPLLVTHSWPGSMVELVELIGPLTDPRRHGGDPAQAFHVVVPSIPGFGFSGVTRQAGWTMARVARAWAELMARLGYPAYAAHGGDFGAMISRELGLADPEHVVGVHVNHLFSSSVGPGEADLSVPAERRSLEAGVRYRTDLAGYAALQGTRPQSLAVGLPDSPVGQLAWIAERFKDWTDSVDSPDDAVDRDALLTNVMLYWLTGTAGSSARYYKDGNGAAAEAVSTVPMAVAVFPRDIVVPVRRIAERTNNIVRWTELDRGGHFAAMEEPDLLIADRRASFRPLVPP
jgi:microsomal epoxide hydrolase